MGYEKDRGWRLQCLEREDVPVLGEGALGARHGFGEGTQVPKLGKAEGPDVLTFGCIRLVRFPNVPETVVLWGLGTALTFFCSAVVESGRAAFDSRWDTASSSLFLVTVRTLLLLLLATNLGSFANAKETAEVAEPGMRFGRGMER